MAAPFVVARAQTAADLADVRALFRAYQARLSVDLSYQGFAAELEGLPQPYAPPHGALLIARNGAGAAIGCVALRSRPDAGVAEMKGLYVAPQGRGLGIGRMLVRAACAEARTLGYRSICLDSLPEMGPAIGLYRAEGFTDCAPYYDTPIAGTAFLRKDL